MNSLVLVVNAGSSSLKYQVLDENSFEIKTKGSVERIGEEGFIADHNAALEIVVNELKKVGIELTDFKVVGHRIVHGGEKFNQPILIDEKVIEEIELLIPLAPLHNQANLAGIRSLRSLLPNTPQVAVFDTAFHSTIPAYASTYAIPSEISQKFGIKKYGFHGTSHEYVTHQTAMFLGKNTKDINLIICHIGNGASVTAVKAGQSIDTSMGLTPLEGLVMGTRSGDIDPGIIFHLHRVANMNMSEIDDLLNKHSGLMGLAGSVDMREIWQRAKDGDSVAILTRKIYAYRIQKYISAFLGLLPNIDGIVFTAGVGENDWHIRELVLMPLEHLGLVIDNVANRVFSSGNRQISQKNSRIDVFVIPTNEEVAIAKASLLVVN